MKLSQFIAGCFGITGFVVSILAGLYVNNSFDSILIKAMLAAVICYIVGYGLGVIAQYAANEHAVAIAKKVAAEDAEILADKAAKAAEENENANVAAVTATAA